MAFFLFFGHNGCESSLFELSSYLNRDNLICYGISPIRVRCKCKPYFFVGV